MKGNHENICPPIAHEKAKIQFEGYLNEEAINPKNDGVSGLNLYKRALKEKFDGIWLPKNHQATFLASLRRKRSYAKKNPVTTNNSPETSDVSVAVSEAANISKKDVGTSPLRFLFVPCEYETTADKIVQTPASKYWTLSVSRTLKTNDST